KLFFRGRFDARAYAMGLARLEPVYAALEEGLRTHENTRVFLRHPIMREAAVRSDRRRYGEGVDPVDTPYARRIRDVTESAPHRLVGHVYVRYFADLSGVAKMARVAHRLLGLPADAPLAYFSFPAEVDKQAVKTELRAAIDRLERRHHEAVIDEARRSFRLHKELTDELLSVLERS
ncbi:MAG: biliverdin-producing heme oxygenase, partial [Myxococcota bacterium]